MRNGDRKPVIVVCRGAEYLGDGICANLGVKACPTTVVKFDSNENLLVTIDKSVRGDDVFVISPSCPPVHERLFELMMTIDALKSASAARVTAVLPYFPYARSDKKDQPRISITARLVADMLVTAGVDRILTMDLHSPQVAGFFPRNIPVDVLKAVRLICEFWRKRDLDNTVLVAGDAGEAKEIGPYASRLNLKFAIVDKRRPGGNDDKPKAVNIVEDRDAPINGRRCIIVDDEVSSGGTLIEAANFLMERGAASVSATCVHPVLGGNAIPRLTESIIDELVVCGSLPTAEKSSAMPKLTVIQDPVTRLIGDAIGRIHRDESVSELFL